ncbi:FAD-dependent pyridine nucleotide-disulfide oxidoreductase [Serinicoccus hydrothermalis]|uniref:FAD-dependent pyridine nucleotide-disulfide oxidoreductase n=1 Tax=Serinicoccus hydrothermalis TaxID=1758689 RepID=A0A1B1N8D7_9MICO|nr:FAD/NAD(P)-binding oxidoreductase [Serinicoccus hydrothermalis]ANS77697.1 FAD-dependent pyridine nucleotide-disulfide oxidoreductase [Serinicoccus hydrothermalis]
MDQPATHHHVLIVGGGTAGISVAARLRRKGVQGIAVIEPSETHDYQPLWTLVGGGCATAAQTRRAEAGLIPEGVVWVRASAVGVDPESKVVTLNDGARHGYEYLVMAPGIQLDWDRIDGLTETLGQDGVSSNYRYDLAPKTWDFIRTTRSGSAVFGMPSGPIKCAGAPQKIAYLACDYWRQQGVLDQIEVHLVLPTPGMFGVPVFAQALEKVARDYGITVHLQSEVTVVDSAARTATVTDLSGEGTDRTLPYDVMHLVPPQSAPDWVKASPLAAADNPDGYVSVDKHTMQHTAYPDVFALGDAGSTPNSKTGAAIRKQAPVLVENLHARMLGGQPTASYDGYASCPLTTSRRTMLLAEFDYSMEPAPTFPIIDATRPRRDMWYLKKYGLPAMYWNGMLKGVA